MKQKHIKKISKLIDSLIINILLKAIYKIKYFFIWYFWNFTKKFNKILNNLIKKPFSNFFLKISDLTGYFFKKKIIKNFNTITQKVFFKFDDLKKKFLKRKLKVSNFNKVTITFISLLFIYLFYLLIPTFYEKTWVQNTLEKKLQEDFKINFSTSSNITYNILPKPHFLIKNSKIIKNENKKPIAVAELKILKVYIYQKNFFKKEEMKIKNITIVDANFSFKKKDLKLLNSAIDNKFSNQLIKIKNSKIFFKDNENETISIMKLSNAIIVNEEIDFLNFVDLKGEIFKIPFLINIKKDLISGKKILNLSVKKLKLHIQDESNKISKNLLNGLNITKILSSKIYTKYSIKKDVLKFALDDSKIKNQNFYYKGILSFEPFDFKLNLKIDRYELIKIFNNNSIFGEIIKSKLLFDENISSNISIDINSNQNDEFFNSSFINFNILNGKINFDKSKFFNKKIGSLILKNSDLFFKENNFVFNTDVLVEIKSYENLYSFFQTPKNLRKPIKYFLINLDYDFSSSQVKVNNLKIDGNESNDGMINVLDDFGAIEDYNLNKSKRIFNKLLSAYFG
jgi:hypothetical protein